MKSSRQNRQSEKSGRVRSSRGPPDGKKKGIGAHKPNKPGRKQSNTTRKTLPWLFSQASGAQVSQGHHTENNNSVFDISDDSVSEDNFEADPYRMKNRLINIRGTLPNSPASSRGNVISFVIWLMLNPLLN